MNKRTELKARMIAHLGMDHETGQWINETIARFFYTDIEAELEFFRSLQN